MKRLVFHCHLFVLTSFSVDLAKEVQAVRKSGLTFAPEAGSQRMRDVINKGVTEEDLMNAVGAALLQAVISKIIFYDRFTW